MNENFLICVYSWVTGLWKEYKSFDSVPDRVRPAIAMLDAIECKDETMGVKIDGIGFKLVKPDIRELHYFVDAKYLEH